jgi:hypothetical protein
MSLTRRTIPKAMSTLKLVSRQTASFFTRSIAACGLEALRGIMKRLWAFSVAADASAHVHGVAYFSIRMRLVIIDESKTSLHNAHLLAPPLTGSHTVNYTYDLVLSALDSHWRAKLIDSNSDGVVNMMGIYSGWQVRLLKSFPGSGPFYRIHCGPHRLYLVNGRASAALRETESRWLEKLLVVIKLLRKQANLIEHMESQSPYHVEVSWSSLAQVLHWHKSKSDIQQQFYAQVQAEGFSNLAADPEWWFFVAIIHEHYSLVEKALSDLQGNIYILE